MQIPRLRSLPWYVPFALCWLARGLGGLLYDLYFRHPDLQLSLASGLSLVRFLSTVRGSSVSVHFLQLHSL